MPRSKGVWWREIWWPDPRGTRAWRALRDRVVAEEPLCWLKLPGCTKFSATADHVIPFVERPDLGMTRENLRGACEWCNGRKGNKAHQPTERWTL